MWVFIGCATCPSCGTERQVHHGRVSTYCRRCKPLHAPAKAQEPAEPMPTPSQVPLKRGHSLNHVGGRDRVISTERVVYAEPKPKPKGLDWSKHTAPPVEMPTAPPAPVAPVAMPASWRICAANGTW